MGLRQMLISLRMQDIKMASSGEDALLLCQKHYFDIVLCDYNLGEGKDGQQLLEELRAYQLLKHRAIFIMLTAEVNSVMVLGALENRPDAYLAKPFTRQEILQRLEALLSFKEEIELLTKAQDRRDLRAALAACDELMASKSTAQLHAMRVKCELLVQAGEHTRAKTMLEALLKKRPYLWAKLALAKILMEANDHEAAIELLNEIVATNENYIEAYDMLARSYTATDRPKDAQQILSKAVAKSPKSAERQHRLGEVSRINQDLDSAVRSLRKAVELSQNGMHQHPNIVLEYVDALHEKSVNDQSLAGRRAGKDALLVLDRFKKEIKKDPNASIKGKLLESKVLQQQQHSDKAYKALKEACTMQRNLSMDLGPTVVLELAAAMLELDQYADVLALIEQVNPSDFAGLKNESELLAQMNKIDSHSELHEFKNTLNPDNQRGVELYSRGLLVEASSAFEAALEQSTSSLTVNLNLVQSLLKTMQNGIKDATLTPRLEACFERLGVVETDNPRFDRYVELRRLYTELSNRS